MYRFDATHPCSFGMVVVWIIQIKVLYYHDPKLNFMLFLKVSTENSYAGHKHMTMTEML